MAFSSWLSGLRRRVVGDVRQRRTRLGHRDASLVGAEQLEGRELLSVAALIIGTEIDLTLDSDDDVTVREDPARPGIVQVLESNGVIVTSVSSIPAASVTALTITGGDNQNRIDLSGIFASVFSNPALAIRIDADNGHDTLIGSFDLPVSMLGGDGNDTIVGSNVADTLDGGDGNDSVTSGDGNDLLFMDDGQDFVDAGSGNDSVNGGNGEDTINAGAGDDSVFAGNGEDSVDGGLGNDTLNGDGGIDTIHGDDGNDSILGGEFADSLFGDAGDDTLLGQGGNDTLVGVTGVDRADGGAGNDLIQSALDVPQDDPVPAAAPPVPVVPVPAALSDAVDSTLGIDTDALSHTIRSGAGDGSLTVRVTSTGAFGFGSFPNTPGAGAPYDPISSIVAADTSFDSEVYFRANTAPRARATLESVALNRTDIRGTATEANSTFDVGTLHFVLTQTVEPVLDLVAKTPAGAAQQIGSLLTQTYRITNTGAATADFELLRFADSNLSFDGSLTDGGGRLISAAGDEFLMTTDAGGLSGSTNFVGITSKGGTIPLMGRFEIDRSPGLQTNVQAGVVLDGQITNDTNNDQSIDTDYDVSMGMRNTFRVLPNGIAIYTTHTLFGTGTPSLSQVNLKPVATPDTAEILEGRSRSIDVVANDYDLDGSLDYASAQIVQQPNFGNVFSLGDGRFVYTPDPAFSGTDSFAYTIADNLGARSAPAVVSLTVSALDINGDLHNGGLGNDTVIGADGNDTIFGGAGQDLLRGGVGDDRIQGQAGNDTIVGEGGADVLDGGTGDDLVRSMPDSVIVIPDISINDVTVTEGSSGTTTALVSITLSAPTSVPVQVFVTTTDNVALVGNDFLATNFFVSIPAGQTIGNVAVQIVADTIFEADETFFVNLSAPVNGNLIDAQATVTITNDDATAATQFIFIDFDSATAGADHVYTPAERTTILNRMQQIYAAFPVTFTGTAPTTGPFSTVTLNAPPPGGLASEIDFRNLNYTATATVDINGILGTPGSPPNNSANFSELTAKVATHEAGHFLGLRHDDSFGPIGSGISPLVNPNNFNPPYPGPLTANESTRHIMGSPAATGETILDAISNQFFGEREAVKLSSWAFGGAVVAEQSGAHGSTTTAQPIQPRELFVPNTVLSGSANFGQTFRVNELAVTGNISSGGELDLYRFQGTAGQLINLEVISVSVSTTPPPSTPRYPNSIDSVIRILDASGNVIPYYTGTAINNNGSDSGFPDPDSIIFDLRLPSTGTFFVEVSAAAAADTGNYELYMYDFATYTPAVGGVGNVQTGSVNVIEIGDTIIGGDGNDTLVGAAGNDTINGNAGNDLERGGAGDDSMLGGAGNDTLLGEDGNDTLDGQGGNDVLDGGAGNDIDTLTLGEGNDSVTNSGGLDSLVINADDNANTINVGQVANQLVISNALGSVTTNSTIRSVTVNALGGDDTVTISNLVNVPSTVLTINGGEGQDTLTGAGANLGSVRLRLNGDNGNDSLIGSLSNDTLDGGAGNDAMGGLAGDDTLIGGDGNDTMNGGDGRDDVRGGLGHDSMLGGNGDDSLSGEIGRDALNGGAGNDTLSGGDATDTLNGMEGNDSLLGGVAADTLFGGAGDDFLNGGRNDDYLQGNDGHDTIDGDHGNDTVRGDGGDDVITGGDGDDSIDSGDGNDLIAGQDGNDRVNAGGGDDVIVGGDGNDTLNGGGGNDILIGEEGDDSLNGQGGSDTMSGGQGNDAIVTPAAGEIDELFAVPDSILDRLFG